MLRRVTALVLVVALATLVGGPVQAKKKKKPKPPPAPAPVAVTFHMNWGGDCEGAGFLSLASVPNPDECALFFPELGNSYAFPATEGLPFGLDATKAITVDFELSSAATAAGEFEAVMTGTVGGQDVEIARATQTVLVAANESTPVHFDLQPDAALDKAEVSALTLTINWTGGLTFSTIDLSSGTSTTVVNGYR